MTSDDFARRVKELTPVMYRVCFLQLRTAADRDDAVQEAIFRAWQKRASLRNEDAFRGWLTRILINVCHDIQKNQKRIVPMDTRPEPGWISADDRPAQLRQALMQLDDKLRLPVTLHYLDGYSVKELANIFHITENAVKLRLHRGRAKLRELLQEEVF